MADNVEIDGVPVASDKVTYSGDADQNVQLMRLVGVTGAEGSKTVEEPPPLGRGASSALTTVAYSETNVTLKAANAARRELRIVNDTDRELYLKFGDTATADDWNERLSPGTGMVFTVWTGQIDGIWASGGTGKARVTEVTA